MAAMVAVGARGGGGGGGLLLAGVERPTALVAASGRTSLGSRPFRSSGRVRMGAGARPGVFCSVAVEAQLPPITFHVGETSFTMPFSTEAAKGLTAAIDGLFRTFKEREKAMRPQRWKNMEFRQTGQDGVFFEVFCNPNAYSNAFQAKVLITINDEKIKIASEGQLSALKADIDEYVSHHV